MHRSWQITEGREAYELLAAEVFKEEPTKLPTTQHTTPLEAAISKGGSTRSRLVIQNTPRHQA